MIFSAENTHATKSILLCSCGTPTHSIVFTKYNNEDIFYLSVVNNRTYSFLERIKNAFNALFGFESEVIEIVLEKDHTEKIIDIMNQISKD